jgi:hypothetical protein
MGYSGILKVDIKDIDNYKNKILAKNVFHSGSLVIPRNSVLNKDTIQTLKELSDNSSVHNIFIFANTDKSEDQVINEEFIITAKQYLDDILNNYSYNKTNDTKLLRDVVRLFIEQILSQPYFCNYLENVLLINSNLYGHVIRTATLSIILAIKANLPKNMIYEIGVGGLLHDIGMINLYIKYPRLNDKKHKYSFEEFQLFKTHPILGYNEVEYNDLIPLESKKIILLHHVWDEVESSYSAVNETYMSYPLCWKDNMLTKENKDIAVRIVQIVSIYDTIVNSEEHSVDKRSLLMFWKTNKNLLFGSEVTNLFCNYISPYEVGEVVVLNNGSYAVVKEHTNDNFNPIVLLDDTKTIDLSKSDKLYIDRTEEEGEIVDQKWAENYYYM